MKLKTNLVAIGVVVALGAGQQVVAAQKKEEDSVYKWGRWAVLSPAAGGPPPYVAALAPDAWALRVEARLPTDWETRWLRSVRDLIKESNLDK